MARLNRSDAVARANRLAHEAGCTYFVVHHDDYILGENEVYDVCGEDDLDSFYCGETPLYAAEG